MIIENDSQRWRTLYEISRYLNQQDPLEVDELIQGILERIGKHTLLRTGCILTFAVEDAVETALTLDMDSVGPGLWEHLYQRGLLGFVYHSQRTIVIRDINHDTRWPKPPPDVRVPQGGSALGVPLRVGTNEVGVMMFVHPDVDGFDGRATAMLEEIAMLVAETVMRTRGHMDDRRSSEHFQWLFDDLITPVLLTDRSGNIIKANREACRFLKYTHDNLLSMSIKDIHLSRKRFPSSSGHTTSMKTNHLAAFMTHMKAADSEEIPVRLKVRKRTFRDEPVIEYVMQDVRSEVALDNLRQDLTAMIFHDLRAPLQNIKFSLAALKRVIPADSNLGQKSFAAAESSVVQLNRMIATLLDIQRLEGSSTILNARIVSVERVVRSALDQTSAIVENANLSVRLEMANSLPEAKIDPDMIRRVLTNLIENATKYGTDGGQIMVRVTNELNVMRFVIADDGPGIPPEMRERIFDKFSRVKYNNAPNGVGLGLAFCKLAIEAHGGRIWVESELGKGAAFHFTLPATVGSGQQQSSALSGTV
jgi:two-component system, NtrC family, sensor histidine kinase KinB